MAIEDDAIAANLGRQRALQHHQIQRRSNRYARQIGRQDGENLPTVLGRRTDHQMLGVRCPGYPGNDAVQNQRVGRDADT